MTQKQVPAYRTDLARPRTQDVCVVIPVLNEGERIGRLL